MSFSKTGCAVPEESHHKHVIAYQGRILHCTNNNNEISRKCSATISAAYSDQFSLLQPHPLLCRLLTARCAAKGRTVHRVFSSFQLLPPRFLI